MAKARSQAEIVRRLRLGDLRKLFRHRYGPTLPDDDAGREDLMELLRPISLDPWRPDRKMANVIETAAPWIGPEEAGRLIDWVNRLPAPERMSNAQELGWRLNLSNADRERLRLWSIKPDDMTADQLVEQRKAKKRARDRLRRQSKGVKPRAVYLAGALSRRKPWQREGISRRTWFRRRAKGCGTGPRPVQTQRVAQVRARQSLLKAERTPVPPSKVRCRKRPPGKNELRREQ